MFFRWVGNKITTVPNVQSPRRGGREWGLQHCRAARGFHGSMVHSAQRSKKKDKWRWNWDNSGSGFPHVCHKKNELSWRYFWGWGDKAMEITSCLEFDLMGAWLKESRALVSGFKRLQAAGLSWTFSNTHVRSELSEAKIVTCSWLGELRNFTVSNHAQTLGRSGWACPWVN